MTKAPRLFHVMTYLVVATVSLLVAAGIAQGAVYAFAPDPAVWTRTEFWTLDEARTGTYLGKSVDLQGDEVVAGAYGADDFRGAVYLYSLTPEP